MIETRKIEVVGSKAPPERHLPKIVKWKGVNMVRNHSFLATVQEIIDFSAEIDLVRIGLVGDPHSGKSTLAMTIAHCIHSRAKIPYAIRMFTKKHLLDFEATLKGLNPANYILVFDDVSFLEAAANNKQISKIESAISEIRHLPGGKDVKIIVIMNYHYTKALPPFMRQSEFRYFTTVGSSEKNNMAEIAGERYNGLISGFQKTRRQAVVKKVFHVRISQKEFLPYKYRNPFIPVLFWNNDTLRLIVSPTRKWIDPICAICSVAEGETMDNTVPLEEMIRRAEVKFGKGNFKAAVKLDMFINGLTVHGKDVVRALKYISQAKKERLFSSEQLATHYELTVTKVRLRLKPFDDENILSSEPSPA